MKIPKIKKKINAFLVGEEGKISKKKLMKTGLILSAAIGAIISSENAEAGFALCCSGAGTEHDNTTRGGPCLPPANTGRDHNNVVHNNEIGEAEENGVIQVTHTHCGETHSNHSDHDKDSGIFC